MENQARDFLIIFTSILYEALPFIVLGALISGCLEELVPQRFIAKVLPRSRVLSIAIGGLLGLVFPMCECGIIPVMRRLLRKGLPLSCCICYMLAGPIINVVVILSTWAAFSGMETTSGKSAASHQLGSFGMVVARVGLGYLVAFGTSLIVEWQYRKHGTNLLAPMAIPKGGLEATADDTDESEPKPPWRQRLANISETSLHDFVDITVFLILGALLSAIIHFVGSVYFPNPDPTQPHPMIEWLGRYYPVAILGMMALAILLCLCSEADAFVAASYSGLPPSAKIGFLVLGPMFDFKLLMMFTRVFKPRLIGTIVISVIVQTYIYSFLIHQLLEHVPGFWELLSPKGSTPLTPK